jgi:NitT/TauT family transport system ATP-binding protein
MVFQSFALFPWLKVVENVGVGLEARGLPPGRLKRRRVPIDLVGLSRATSAPTPRAVAGMKQLVGLARALAVEPELPAWTSRSPPSTS